MSRALAVYVALAALTLGVFTIWPNLDLIVAHYFYDGGGFAGRDSLARFGRDVFRVTPFVVLTAFAALWFAKRRGVALRWAPSGRAVIFLIATMAIGPGLIVNLGLKDHWRRPRPYQTQDFSGRARSSRGTRATGPATGTVRSSPARRRPASGRSRSRAFCPRRGASRNRRRVRLWLRREPIAHGLRRALLSDVLLGDS